jgi:RHS repeat-associated protein
MKIIRNDISGLPLGSGDNFMSGLFFRRMICALFIIGFVHPILHAQNYLTMTGVSSSTLPYPAEMGTIDAANGDLHLEIPLGSFPQRANSPLVPKLVYDSHIWTVPTDGTSYVWTTTGQLYGLAFGTWGFDEGGITSLNLMAQGGSNGCSEDMMLWGQSGTQHYFNIPGTLQGLQCSGGTAYAADSSGFQIRQTAWGNGVDAVLSIFAPDGTEVVGAAYPTYNAGKDPNGNYLGLTNANSLPAGIYNPVIDTLGRTVAAPESDSNPMTLQVMNSQGGTSNYVITTATIPVQTDFQQSGITECNNNCTATVITSVGLPDGSSYSFLYDCDSSKNAACYWTGQTAYYGTLMSMTLPTGATISYGYSNFTDSLGGVGRWLTSKQSSAAYWSYTPQATGGTSQQVTVYKADNSKDVISLTVDGSGTVWPTQILSYDTDASTLLSTVNNSWDFSVSCTTILCDDAVIEGIANGDYVAAHQDVRRLSTSTTLPVPGGSITKQTKYTYDSPQTGNVTGVEEWKYQAGSSPTFSSVPDRGTYTKYATIGTNNNINRPTSITVCNNVGTNSSCGAGGTPVSQTTITYDGYGNSGSLALQSVTGAVNHDDTNFGTSYTARGNATQISRLVSGSSVLTTAISYDTTGQIVQVLDPQQNATSYFYTDVFYNDNGADPPATYSAAQKTNAYVTKVTDPIGSTSMGYYYGTGQAALSTDYNSITTYGHYVDPFDRPTKTDYPIGWLLNQYGVPSGGQTEIDSYAAVGDTNQSGSTSCTLCTHTQALLDSLGRVGTGNLVNNPRGEVTVNTSYDSLNRVASSTHPHIGTSDPNNVSEIAHYDGLGRSLGITHPDNESAEVYYGAYVTRVWGALTSQQGSSTTYGLGFPVVSVDEAGMPRQEWIDGFGRVIEVDEPVIGSTPGTGSVSISGYERSGQYCPPGGNCFTLWDGGSVSVTVNSHTTTAPYGDCSQTQSNDTPETVATRLATAINSDSGAYVTGLANGASILLTSKAVGTSTNYSLSASSVTDCSAQVFAPGSTSFPVSASGSTLTGGSSNAPTLSNPLVTNYTYDILGNLTGVTQGSQSRSYQYDGLSRLTQETTPEAGTVTLSYLSSGSLCSGNPSNPCSRTAPAPNQTGSTMVTTTYSYTANRLTEKTHSDSTGTETYTYGTNASNYNIGRLTEMTDPSGHESYSYNDAGEVLEVSKKIGSTTYNVNYSYNHGGQLTKITYPSGRIVYYNYDSVGHLCQVASATSTSCGATSPYLSLPSGSYDASSRPLSATYGNGIVATAAYSPTTFELTGLSYAKGTTTLLGLNYYYQQNSTYCPAGNTVGNNGQIQCIADVSSGTGDSGRSVAYTYDALGRLLTANTIGSTQYPAWGLSWIYDRYGNRTNQNVTAGSGYTSSLTINPVNNQITSPAFTYDAAGNVITEPSPLSTTSAYDGEECNTGYTGNGNTATYTCDGNHLRVEKVVTGTNAVTTVYVRSGGQVIAEYDNGAAVTSPTREHLYGNNLLAIVTGSTGGSGGTIVYQHRDTLSPRIYTDVNGNCVGDQGTYPFGELWYSNNDTSCTNTTSTPWIFTSYERDTESGNDYALARSYANSQGRFLAPDPLEGVVGDPQSWNRYAYVENDPINLSDPSGQGFWEDLGFAIADIFVAIFAPEALLELGVAEDAGQAAQDTQEIEAGLAAIGLITIGATHHGAVSDTTIWGCGGGPCAQGGQQGGSDGGAAPQGGGGPGPQGTDPGSTGAGGATPGGGGTQSPGSGSPAPGGGSTNPNPSAGNVWHSITATEVSNATVALFKGTGPWRVRTINLLNGFGSNWTLSGDNLRTGIAAAKNASGVNIPGTANEVFANIDSISRTGDQVAITNKQPLKTTFANLDKSVTFTIGGEHLQNIRGLKVGFGPIKGAKKSWDP